MFKGVATQRWIRMGCAAMAVVGLTALSAGAKDIEQAQKEISAALDKLKSYTAKMQTKQDMEMGPGMKSKMEMKGTIEMMRKDGKMLTRTDSKNLMVIKTEDPESKEVTENKMESSTLMISDGDTSYTLSDTNGMKSAIKMKTPPQGQADLKKAWELLGHTWNIKVLDDEKLDGKECIVVEMTPKKEEPQNPIARMVYHYRKDLGISVKMESFDKEKKSLMLTTVTDIKTDVDLKPDRFKFEAPEGVQIMDMTSIDPLELNKDATSEPAESK